ncbi:hypothetical protein AM482_004321 [Pseudomonas aeruginosa]|nr:hypothetical protein AM482_004321 [Pseudomonas aeruginosa]
MSITYTISDLARELDITTRAIRFYEEQGLLSPSDAARNASIRRATRSA